MTKRIFALMLAVFALLCTVTACSPEDDVIDDPVINIGTESLVYKDSQGDTFTYEYLSSTTVAITDFAGNDEPHLVTIPAVIEERQVVAIADGAFRAKSNISDIKCEADVVSIGKHAFAYCEALKTVELPASVETIDEGAFYNCSSLVSCTLSEGLTTIGFYAFANCASLPTITFPKTLTSIGAFAFGDCVALTAIIIPEGTVSVGAQAFYKCTAVKTLSLPASLTEIGDYAFNPVIRDLADEDITVVDGSVAAEHISQFR